MATQKNKLEEVIHLYLGCELYAEFDDGSSGTFALNEYYLRNIRSNWISDKPVPTLIKPLLRQLSDITEEEINKVCSILLDKETTCGKIWRSDNKDFIIATFKQEKPLPTYDKDYKSMSMGIYIKNNCHVDYKWCYYTEENCEGSCGVTTEPLHNHHEITRYMLKQGFDLFSLIETGQAIDKNTLQETKN